MTPLEESLATEFRQAAEHAPLLTPDLRARVEHGHRRRRHRRVALAAVAAVTATVAAVAAGTSFSGRPAERVATPQVIAPMHQPIDKMWPDALHTVEAKLPNGRFFAPELFIDSNAVLVRELRPDSIEPRDIWSIDLRTNAAKRLVRITPSPGTTILRTALATGDGQVAWYATGNGRIDIWTAPIAGGQQRKVTSQATVPRYEGVDLAITDGDAVWSRAGAGGIFRAPLTGGKPEPIPGTAKQWIVSWPWAGSPEGSFKHLVNLATGEKRDATGNANCRLSWCTVDHDTVRMRDGSNERTLPGGIVSFPPALDRFLPVMLAKSTGEVLYDLKTGRMGDLGYRPRNGMIETARMFSGANGLFSFFAGKDKVVIVDLKVIASAS